MSLQAAIAAAAGRLTAAGVASPRFDAEELAAHVLGIRRGSLVLARGFTPAEASAYDDVVRRRADREPLQHLLGSAPFRWLEVAVGPGVFVPRPETESVVGWALSRAEPGALCVDLCSGSGAIALALATELPGARVHAVEVDPAAFGWLARNTAGTTVRAVLGDAATALGELDATVDLVVSNPPYVPLSTAVEPEVHADPALAVFGGADGLAVVRVVADAAWRLLRAGGRLVVEHDDTHGEAVPALLRAGGWTEVSAHTDLGGGPRFASAVRPDRLER